MVNIVKTQIDYFGHIRKIKTEKSKTCVEFKQMVRALCNEAAGGPRRHGSQSKYSDDDNILYLIQVINTRMLLNNNTYTRR